jgi:tetratricopeptide (TPR) repeat protein
VLRTKAFLVLFLVLAVVAPVWAADFTQADLEKMVTELDHVIPENPKYEYPVNCTIVESDEVNAYATVKKDDTGLRASMVVYTGLVKNIGGDQRLIRAVVAHELSHLSRGHLDDLDPAARDLRNLWTRQQEFEADKYGAKALVDAGYSKKDMVDMLLFLDRQNPRDGGWLEGLTADHADAKARAAEIADDPSALKALVSFDTALAFEDARSHIYAQKMFNYAAEQWPSLTDAYINAGECALLYYYDNLPLAVRDQWWRPDFGPLITNPHVYPQGIKVEDEDRKRWKDAMSAIDTAVTKNPGNEEAEALLALGYVLEPDSKPDAVNAGIKWFDAEALATKDEATRLRFANNAAVGYSQLGNFTKATETLMNAQRGSNVFNPALGENLGLVGPTSASKDDNTLAANVLFTWLNNTPQTSDRWDVVKKTFDDICTKAGIQANAIKPKPGYLCQVMTLVSDNKEIGLLLPVDAITKFIGAPQDTITFADKWPDLTELRWSDGALTMLTERNEIMRVTSYVPGAYLNLKPTDTTSQSAWQVKVGMSKDELSKILDPSTAVPKDLAKGDKVESWSYFADLGIGVLLEGDVVTGITVTPVQYETKQG